MDNGLEVKLCPNPGDDEVFILCRRTGRREKEGAMHVRFEKRIEASLLKLPRWILSCQPSKDHEQTLLQQLGL